MWAFKVTLRQVMREYINEQGKKAKGGEKAKAWAKRRIDLLVTPYETKPGHKWLDRPLAKITKAEFPPLMLMVPVRPGALAFAKVKDDKRSHSLWIEEDKVNPKRWVKLPDDKASRDLMQHATKSKLPVAKGRPVSTRT